MAGLVRAFVIWSVLGCALPALAQNTGETQKKLERVRGELKSISAERRKLEDQRGDASRDLRDADVRVAKTSRALTETEAAIAREARALGELQTRRDAMRAHLDKQRKQLVALVRAAYQQGEDAPLKVLLSQDHLGDAGRAMAYHGYLQRDHATRIADLTTQMQALTLIEQDITDRRQALAATRVQQQRQVDELQQDRKSRATVISELDARYKDRSAREAALGRDAKSLETLLANLREAARKAEAERRAAETRRLAEERAAAKAAATAKAEGKPAPPPRPERKVPPAVASAPALKVGGLSWPVSGNLLAKFGGRMPDGRSSAGVLIGASQGATVTAVAEGTVVFSDWMTGYGNILIIDHGNGYMSLYAHNEALLRDVGTSVKRGESVAKVGSSGGQGMPALYFELRRNGQPVDPSSWLQRQ
ncbi:MAG: peptidoglycan DD-metalloendopeptidase family protein [Pseudoxanthomonas sp.]